MRTETANHPLFLQFQKTPIAPIREQLIIEHMDLVRQLAKRFVNKGKSLESLVSVGTIALIKAIDRYDINKGAKFVTYATHCILGEIKRYFRDSSWSLGVPRRLKELNAIVHITIGKMTQELGRSPRIEEIADRLNISKDETVEAIEAGYAYSPFSLEADLNSEDKNEVCLSDFISEQGQSEKSLFDKIDLQEAMDILPDREQMVINLFYYENLPQAKIAKRLGISQMHVSRLLHQAITKLREFMEE